MLDNFLNIIQCANEGEEKETDGYIQDIEIAEGRKMGKSIRAYVDASFENQFTRKSLRFSHEFSSILNST